LIIRLDVIFQNRIRVGKGEDSDLIERLRNREGSVLQILLIDSEGICYESHHRQPVWMFNHFEILPAKAIQFNIKVL